MPKGPRSRARLARRGADGGGEVVSGLTKRPSGVQCTKPGVQITYTAAPRSSSDEDRGDLQGSAGRRTGKGAPSPVSLTSNISPMRTQSTRQKPMSAWLWMTNSWLKRG